MRNLDLFGGKSPQTWSDMARISSVLVGLVATHEGDELIQFQGRILGDRIASAGYKL